MKPEEFIKQIQEIGISTLIGVPDSALKSFCDYINKKDLEKFHHYVPANEGAAVGMAIGTYLATGRAACIYMQNSGIGNAVNPLTSLAHEDIYGIPMLMLIGWRGEPNVKDEPQHKVMGRMTKDILNLLEIESIVMDCHTSKEELSMAFRKANTVLMNNRQFAFIIKKDFFDKEEMSLYKNNYCFIREDAIRAIISYMDEKDVLISTTGKISREVYEQSNMIRGQHAQSFLTVGGMGHASMIALGIAKEQPNKKVYCLDGDGAAFMHMGNMAFIAKQNPCNLVHICLNNEAHESVGGMPTGSVGLKYAEVAKSCGYPITYTVCNLQELQEALDKVEEKAELSFIEVMVRIKSRDDLGRPKETPTENKRNFMKYHGVTE